jgi:hypothetical protein
MAYADFELEQVVRSFGLIEDDWSRLFLDVEPIEPSETLREHLDEFAPVALGINSDQARREFIISPILVEAKRRSKVEINVLPGIRLDVDEITGLTGPCDYLIARSSKFYYLESPVVAVVQARREDLVAGFGPCVAEMIAIQVFNERDGTPLPVVYSCVTSGTNWRFLKLERDRLFIDAREYSVKELATILGILIRMTRG